MKSKALLISFFVLLLSAVQADAQDARRPFLARLLGSPAVREVANFAVHQFLPGFPQLPPATPNSANVKITVSSVVKTNLAATKTNLASAEKKLNKLFEQNGLKKKADANNSNANDDDPDQMP